MNGVDYFDDDDTWLRCQADWYWLSDGSPFVSESVTVSPGAMLSVGPGAEQTSVLDDVGV